jgi:hypothetical protein
MAQEFVKLRNLEKNWLRTIEQIYKNMRTLRNTGASHALIPILDFRFWILD